MVNKFEPNCRIKGLAIRFAGDNLDCSKNFNLLISKGIFTYFYILFILLLNWQDYCIILMLQSLIIFSSVLLLND